MTNLPHLWRKVSGTIEECERCGTRIYKIFPDPDSPNANYRWERNGYEPVTFVRRNAARPWPCVEGENAKIVKHREALEEAILDVLVGHPKIPLDELCEKVGQSKPAVVHAVGRINRKKDLGRVVIDDGHVVHVPVWEEYEVRARVRCMGLGEMKPVAHRPCGCVAIYECSECGSRVRIGNEWHQPGCER